MFASACAFLAIREVGLSVGSGVWSGVAVLDSFAYGHVIMGEPLHNPPLAYCALGVILAGIGAITFVGRIAAAEGSTSKR